MTSLDLAQYIRESIIDAEDVMVRAANGSSQPTFESIYWKGRRDALQGVDDKLHENIRSPHPEFTRFMCEHDVSPGASCGLCDDTASGLKIRADHDRLERNRAHDEKIYILYSLLDDIRAAIDVVPTLDRLRALSREFRRLAREAQLIYSRQQAFHEAALMLDALIDSVKPEEEN